MHSPKDHISICIPTYKRPKLLSRLLCELQKQNTANLFTFSILIVDNDSEKSGKNTVESFKKDSLIETNYFNEPEKNFALVRNKAVVNAKGTLIAFIDDDEFPEKTWLVNLYKTLIKYKADGVLGPVMPHYEQAPPTWIIQGKFCERPFKETGSILSVKDTRSGNVLLNRNIFKNPENMFDPKFGTGGEDTAFFLNLLTKKYVFVACKEAPVYESVPAERLKKTYFLRRALLDGAISAKLTKDLSLLSFISVLLKTVSALIIYTLSLPFLFFYKEHIFMIVLMKNCHHFSRLLGFMGIDVIKVRNF